MPLAAELPDRNLLDRQEFSWYRLNLTESNGRWLWAMWPPLVDALAERLDVVV